MLLKVSSPVNKVYSFSLEFYVCCRVSPPKSVFLVLTQEHIYTIEFCSLATTKQKEENNNKSTNNACLHQNTTVVGMIIKDKRDNSQ